MHLPARYRAAIRDSESVRQAEVAAWTDAVGRMYYGESIDPGDLHAAERATANLMSGWGIGFSVPTEVALVVS